MRNLSQSGRTKDTKFVEYVCDISRRGDTDAIIESMQSYFENKRAHPWHRIYKIIQKKWSGLAEKELQQRLIQIRDAVFSALGILSLSLALDVPTQEILEIFCKAKTWKEGRMKVRSYCLNLVTEMIQKKKVKHLDANSLARDGFEFLTHDLFEANLEQFKKAKPQVKKGKLMLGSLQNTKFGRALLRELDFVETSIDESDPMAEEILKAYDNRLLELELAESEFSTVEDTVQVTLNGNLVETEEDATQEGTVESAGAKAPKKAKMRKVGTKASRAKKSTGGG